MLTPKLKEGYIGLPTVVLISVFAFFVLLWWIAAFPTLIFLTLAWILLLSVFWAPVVLLQLTILSWRNYIRSAFIARQKGVLLEVKIPRHVYKTPRAMELVFSGLNVGPGETTFISRWWEGKLRPWWSLEITSFEGEIHFFIWTFEKHKDFTMSQFYAQYPNIEIYEVEDYAAGIEYDPQKLSLWGAEYTLDKADGYPIATYIDFGLDQDAHKSEQVIDPLSGILEKMSTLGKGEMMWVQFVIRQNKGGDKFGPRFWRKGKSWKKETEELIQEIYDRSKPQTKDLVTGEITEGYPLLQPAEVTTIKALERSIEKSAYDAGIRAIYLGHPDDYKGHRIPTYVVSLFNSFGSGHLNELQVANFGMPALTYPWQDFRGMRERAYAREVLDAYRRRAMFYQPHEQPRFVLTTEELATLFHFPSEETRTPGLERISSTKGEAPTNLPV